MLPPSLPTVGVVLAVGLTLVLSLQMFSYGRSFGQHDYYQFWAVGRLAGTGVTDIYSDAARTHLGPVIQAQAARSSSLRAVRGAADWTKLETYGTPFLYAMFGIFSTGDYDLDSGIWQLLSLAMLLGSVLALGRVFSLSWLASFLLAAIVVGASSALTSDVRTGNVTQFQVGLVSLFIVMRARWRTPRGDVAAGTLLALAIAFKPNMAVVAALLVVLWIIDRRPWTLARQFAGFALGGGAAIAVGAIAWGTFRPWFDWVGAFQELGRSLVYTSNIGNYGIPQLLRERYGVDVSTELIISLVGVTVAAMAIGAWRRQRSAPMTPGNGAAPQSRRQNNDFFEREILAVSAGLSIVLIAAPLSWLYYYLLLVPAQVFLLRSTGRATSTEEIARKLLVGLTVVLLAFSPIEVLIGVRSSFESAIQSILAASIILGLTLYELARRPRERTVVATEPHPEAQVRQTFDRARTGLIAGMASLRRMAATPPDMEPPMEVPHGPIGKLAIALLVAAPMVVTAIWLLPEFTIAVANLNDDAFQFLLIQRMDETLKAGGNPLDFWVPQLELGFPQALYYQSFPHLVVVLLDRLTLGTVDLYTMFNGVRWVLFVALPLTVYWSMRRMGFSMVVAAMAAAVSPLLSGDFRYGFDYDSYIWRGWGMFTQLWAMHLSFIALACVHRVINKGTGYILAMVALSVLLLSHLIYAYMMAITVLLIVVVGARRTTIVPRLVRLGIVGAVVLAVTAYQWLPFITSRQYLSASPYLEAYKYDSYGAPAILGWLFTGDLLDHGRLPVLTLLLALGIVAAVMRRTRLNIFVLAGFVFWLILYFGRPTLGPLFDFFPLSDGLLIHRFIGEMELFAIPLMGLGGALIWEAVQRLTVSVQDRLGNGAWRPLAAAAVLILILIPAMSERAGFYSVNDDLMRNSNASVQTDAGLQAIIKTLKSFPDGGRVYAGLREDWGKQLALGGLNVRDVLTFNQIAVVGPPYQGLSLNSSLIWWFRDQESSQYDLVDARYVITPAALPVPAFYSLIQQSGKYNLYRVTTTGAAEYVSITSRQHAATQNGLFSADLDWFRSDQPGANRFVHWDYMIPSGPPDQSTGCPDGKTLFEIDKPDSLLLVVDCSVAADLVLKVTYHPNWTVTVDGQPVSTFMASPSYVGIQLPAGKHQVAAVYQATPSKTPLLSFGLVLLAVAVVFRRRLDWLPMRLGSMRLRRRAAPDEAA